MGKLLQQVKNGMTAAEHYLMSLAIQRDIVPYLLNLTPFVIPCTEV